MKNFNEIEYKVYTSLNQNSIKALSKTTKKYGHPYRYRPRSDLLARIKREFNLDTTQAYNVLISIRQKLIS